jgi:hypothetical protein
LGMLVAPRGLASAHLACIAQSQARRVVQYDHKRAGLGRLVVRSMSDEGKAAQKSVESRCVQSLHVTLHASGNQTVTMCICCDDVAFDWLRRAPQKAEQGEVTLFDKIVSKQIPATILYEDETALAFK